MDTIVGLLFLLTMLVWLFAGLLVLKLVRKVWKFVLYGLSFRVIVKAVQRRYQ